MAKDDEPKRLQPGRFRKKREDERGPRDFYFDSLEREAKAIIKRTKPEQGYPDGYRSHILYLAMNIARYDPAFARDLLTYAQMGVENARPVEEFIANLKSGPADSG